MNKLIRAAVFERADGACECGCNRPLLESGHLDHFWGRAKAKESIESCWALCLVCDDNKTNNRPTAIAWCDRFYLHAIKHGYHQQAQLAATRVSWLEARGVFNAMD